MDIHNDKPAPGTDNPPTNYIPFKNLAELRRSMEKLDYLNKLNTGMLKAVLDSVKAPYQELENGSILLERGAVTDPEALECVSAVINQNRDRIIDLFKQLGVITTRQQFEGDEVPKIYQGLIDALNNRQN